MYVIQLWLRSLLMLFYFSTYLYCDFCVYLRLYYSSDFQLSKCYVCISVLTKRGIINESLILVLFRLVSNEPEPIISVIPVFQVSLPRSDCLFPVIVGILLAVRRINQSVT
jgi:hypothetical protein